MRLIYFYYSTGNCVGLKFDKTKNTENKWINQFWTEGQCNLFRELISQGIIDGCTLVVESGIESGYKQLFPDFDAYVVPDLSDIIPYIADDDILFMRGGWKSWVPTIEHFVRENRNLLFYAANTGRMRWPYWNCCLDDLHDHHYTGGNNRLYWHYRKPINQDIFYHKTGIKQKYDFMIGASNIHDKKGQWRAVEMLVYLKQKYGYNPKSILPGALRRGAHTNELLANIKNHNLNVELAGMVSREQLAETMRGTKVFIHAGAGGQGDRGPMEAMACGCYTGVHATKYHAPFVYKNNDLTFVNPHGNISVAAEQLHVDLAAQKDRKAIADYFDQECGINICINDFTKLIKFLVNHPKRNQKELLKYYELDT